MFYAPLLSLTIGRSQISLHIVHVCAFNLLCSGCGHEHRHVVLQSHACNKLAIRFTVLNSVCMLVSRIVVLQGWTPLHCAADNANHYALGALLRGSNQADTQLHAEDIQVRFWQCRRLTMANVVNKHMWCTLCQRISSIRLQACCTAISALLLLHHMNA